MELLFKEAHINWAAQKIDDVIDFKKLIKNDLVAATAEALDKPAAVLLLKGLNAKVSEFIPDDYKQEVWEILDDLTDGDKDYTATINAVCNILEDVLDEVELNETVESVLSALIALLRVGLVTLLEGE